jgi:hypothetical protein
MGGRREFSDPGQPAGSSFQGGEEIARGKRREDSDLLLAQLLTGAEPGRVAQCGPESACDQSGTSQKQNRTDPQCYRRPAQHSEAAR